MSLLDVTSRHSRQAPLRVAVIVGTRPEAIKLAPVVLALRAHADVEAQIWCSGQHPSWACEMLAYFGLRPDLVLDLPPRTAALAQLCSMMLGPAAGSDRGYPARRRGGAGATPPPRSREPWAAAYAGLPVVHVEAGLRSSDRRMPFPEEAHRRAIAQFTALHCAPTLKAADTLLAEGFHPGEILESGNTVHRCACG